LFGFGLIDGIIEEPFGGAHTDTISVAKSVEATVTKALDELTQLDPEERIELRIQKYGKMGQWTEK
jgi:acetyl-CoA carboxylase carboxyl transferase subunit alpha